MIHLVRRSCRHPDSNSRRPRERFAMRRLIHVVVVLAFANSCALSQDDSPFTDLVVQVIAFTDPQFSMATEHSDPESRLQGEIDADGEVQLKIGEPLSIRVIVTNSGADPTLDTCADFGVSMTPFSCVVLSPDGSEQRVDIRHSQRESGRYCSGRSIDPGESIEFDTYLFNGTPTYERENGSQGGRTVRIANYVFPEEGVYRVAIDYHAGDYLQHVRYRAGVEDTRPPVLRSNEIEVVVQGTVPNWSDLVDFGILDVGIYGWWRAYLEASDSTRAQIDSLLAAANRPWLFQLRDDAMLQMVDE